MEGRVEGRFGMDGRVVGRFGMDGRVVGRFGIDGRVVGRFGMDGRVEGRLTDGRLGGRAEGRLKEGLARPPPRLTPPPPRLTPPPPRPPPGPRATESPATKIITRPMRNRGNNLRMIHLVFIESIVGDYSSACRRTMENSSMSGCISPSTSRPMTCQVQLFSSM